MSDIDFQNGFVCGMSTKGLVRSGNLYEPTIWNDSGIYSYFYIDFHRAVEIFSMGMLSESIVIHDSVQIVITNFEYVSMGVYKIYADISGKTKGVTVINKATSYLYFITGEKVPVFSTMFYVAGLDRYERLKYIFEGLDFVIPVVASSSNEITYDLEFPEAITVCDLSENCNITAPPMTVNEKTVTVVLT